MLLQALLQSIPAPASTVRGAVPRSRAPTALPHHSTRGSQGGSTSLPPGSCMWPPPGSGLLGTKLRPARTLTNPNKQMQPHGLSDTGEYSPNTDRLSQTRSWLFAGWGFSSRLQRPFLHAPDAPCAAGAEVLLSSCSPTPAQPRGWRALFPKGERAEITALSRGTS